jgi:DNA-binding transcriptional regulator YiaG
MGIAMTAADIETFRKTLNLSQAELADKLGVSQASVSQWESGKKRPRRTVLLMLEMLRTQVAKRVKHFSNSA